MRPVTADTNILVSGLKFRRGKPFQLLELARSGKICFPVSQPILDGVEDVLRRKFHWNEADISTGIQRIREMAKTVIPNGHLNVIKQDPDDNKILECASTAGADFIVSGDKDLLRLGRYDSIRILTVYEFLALPARDAVC